MHVHSTFLILLVFFALTGNLLWPLFIFTMVVLHELGHALAARQFGIGTRDITLYPMGGVAALNRPAHNVKEELAITAAGPLVNFALAGVAWFGAPYLGMFAYPLFMVNMGLGLFNLLPAFPMDGGRILRALLAMKFGYEDATRMAASLGRMMAWGFGLWGLFTASFNLVLIGVFVWLAATAELAQLHVRRFLNAPPVGTVGIGRTFDAAGRPVQMWIRRM